MNDPHDWDVWLDAVVDRGVNLTVWEEEFIERLVAQRAGPLQLTDAQARSLERIYAERTP